MDNQTVVLEMKNIVKYFPGVKALKDANLQVRAGEVHALLGENGAGKSTLMNILLGSLQPDGGQIAFKGVPYTPKSPADALNLGISMIHQELKLVPDMTVAENIWLGREGLFTKHGIVAVKRREKTTVDLLERFKIDLSPNTIVRNLSLARKQLVEIVRAASYNAEVIIMDEPTSSLTRKEVELLFRIIKQLAAHGVAIIFISHKLEEVQEICDRITVMRDGWYIDTSLNKEITREDMVSKMVGRVVTNYYPKLDVEIGETILSVNKLTRAGYFKDVSFSVRRGEILGFCGLIGAGRTELMECIFGTEPYDQGEIIFKERVLKKHSSKDAIEKGMSLVVEDRLHRGIIADLSLEFNMSIAYLNKASKLGWVANKRVCQDCENMKNQLSIKAHSLNQKARELSGGNQQKMIIGRCLLTEPDILILDEPTRGVDVGAKTEIYQLIGELAQQGMAILFVSSELPELIGITDRIVVMAAGGKTAEFTREEYDGSRIMQHAFV